MSEYYVLLNQTQEGPYSKEDLRKLNLSRTTLIWNKELDDWTELKNVNDLKFLRNELPPEVNLNNKKSTSIKSKLANQIISIFRILIASFIIGTIFFIGFGFYNNLFSYKFFNKDINFSDTHEVLGYKPNQFQFNEVSSNGQYGRSSGFMEISDSGKEEVREIVVEELLEESFQFSLYTVIASFLILILIFYLIKGIRWVRKYSS
ncbi:DUF4339 domain-containing protein [Salinimicrobium gaetbulicola]|uniref:DUF4339 domain-containing protein n=1 Tax=Salinimicrobium gaetbulicola TaxID=999702 RepID=A0ABW3IFD9_9FLAO